MSQKKKGFYLDDEDQETSMYFNGQTQSGMFRDRDAMFNAGSPSQAFTPTNQVYQQQQQQSAMNRAYNGNVAAFQRSTPTSMLQPQSPNRNNVLGNLAQRGFQHMNQSFMSNIQQQQQQSTVQSMQKRLATPSNYSGFGQPQAFSFQQSRAVSGGPGSANDMQNVSQMSIDLSSTEFPSLTNRAVPQSSLPSIRNYDGSQQYTKDNWNLAIGMVGGKNAALESGSEFSMQQEDFPALPGSAPASQNGSDSTKPQTNAEQSNLTTKDGLRTELKPQKGVQSLPDGTVTNIPAGMVTDQFGMVGLLTFIRAAETDANLVALAPGVDLTSLGLNLNSIEPLYSTFQSPWAESPCRPQDIDYHVPTEYLTNTFIREKLSPIKLNKYGEDLLFYLFYTNPGDVLQMAASSELYNRDWRYHKEEQVWITRAPGMDPQMKTNTYERGHYYVFNPQSWRKVLKELHLEYSKLEERPQGIGNQQQQQLPSHPQQQQQPPQAAHATAPNSSIATH